MVFTAPALPEWRDDRRLPWWNDPGGPFGDWRVAEQCRFGIDRLERDAFVVCLQEECRPVPEALVVLEEAGGPAGPPLARGVTNDRGEARLRLRGDGWPSTGPFRIRILLDADD
jgi:hypothetical protein